MSTEYDVRRNPTSCALYIGLFFTSQQPISINLLYDKSKQTNDTQGDWLLNVVYYSITRRVVLAHNIVNVCVSPTTEVLC